MEIPTYPTPTVQQWETIMATFLVSDWNIRAWTLLGAVKKRRPLHILTKNNSLVDFQAGVKFLCDHGAMDLVVLLPAAAHLFLKASPMHGFEEIGHMLTHRHASRLGRRFGLEFTLH